MAYQENWNEDGRNEDQPPKRYNKCGHLHPAKMCPRSHGSEMPDWHVLHRDQVQGLNPGVPMVLESGVYPWIIGVISFHRNTQRDTYTDEGKNIQGTAATCEGRLETKDIRGPNNRDQETAF